MHESNLAQQKREMEYMKKRISLLTGLLIVAVLIGLTTSASSKPGDGFTLHIDARMHFTSNPDIIAHHYCKTVAGGLIECLLFDSDAEDAKLVGVETVVSTDIYNTFSDAEKALWHYHKTELPRVEARLPDLPPEEAAKVVKSLEETYGKLYILWDPGKSDLPIGNPSITVLDPTPRSIPATPSSTPKMPGFESVFTIAGLLAGAYIVMKKYKKV